MLWEAIARHYRDEPWVPGYDLINEPADPRAKPSCRSSRAQGCGPEVDPAHVLFIEGNTYAREFESSTPPGRTSSTATTTTRRQAPSSGPYPGETGGRYYDSEAVEADFLKKSQSCSTTTCRSGRRVRPLYTADAQKDEMRYRLLKDQLAIYDKHGASWCIWLYRDLGFHASSTSPRHPLDAADQAAARQEAAPRRRRLGLAETGIREGLEPIDPMLTREFPAWDPYPNGAKREARLLIRNILIAEALLAEYGKAFEGLSEAKSWRWRSRSTSPRRSAARDSKRSFPARSADRFAAGLRAQECERAAAQ